MQVGVPFSILTSYLSYLSLIMFLSSLNKDRRREIDKSDLKVIPFKVAAWHIIMVELIMTFPR